jgi:hypothetical protein
MEAAAARGRDLKQARANRSWMDETTVRRSLWFA